MAKTVRHKRKAAKKAANVRRTTKEKKAAEPTRWAHCAGWRNRVEPAATFHQILNTFELLEHTLSYLPIRDLYICGQVCFKLKSTIEQSTIIGQKLYLVPDYSYKPLWKVQKRKLLNYDNPISHLYANKQEYLDPETGHEACQLVRSFGSGQPIRIPKIINPLILDLLPYAHKDYSLATRLGHFDMIDHTFEKVFIRIDMDSLAPDASTRKMYLTQPPSRAVRLLSEICGCGNCSRIVRSSEGVTFSDMIEEYQSFYKALAADHHKRPPLWKHPYPMPVRIQILDGFGVTETERAIVDNGDQTDTSGHHAKPGRYRMVYPRLCHDWLPITFTGYDGGPQWDL